MAAEQVPPPGTARSAAEFERDDLDGFGQRASLKSMGFTEESARGRPVIGICNTASDLVHCNRHFRELVEHIKRGVHQAGGVALEFPVISLGEPFMKPTTMLYRNLMAMDVEESIRSYPIDAVVLTGGCDKTTPAQIMGAISADVPAIMLAGGPQLNGVFAGRSVGTCTDCWRTSEGVRSGEAEENALRDLEDAIVRSAGHCSTMGTASTMACIVEALGLGLPGGAAIPAVDSRRARIAEVTGRTAVELARSGLTPRQIVSERSIDNAIRVWQAIGGSTNAVIHLVAIARRLGFELPLERFDDLGRETPLIANVKPSGEHLMEDFFFAGGVPAVMEELRELMHLDERTVSGLTWRDHVTGSGTLNPEVIRPVAESTAVGSTVVLRGNLCPDGAVLKISAADEELLVHEGRALVFEGLADLYRRIHSPELDVTAEDVLVLRGVGPVGGPGMPECGHIPIPTKLLRAGVKDMVRVSDARMSGTAYGTCVLHAAPEAAVGGPLALVRDGDRIRLDVPARRLDVLIDEGELARRRADWRPPAPRREPGYTRLYTQHVLQANLGCDFDFLVDADAPA